VIIPALVKRYNDQTSRADSGIAPPGYSVQKIGFEIVLNPDGSLHDIQRVFDTETITKTKRVKGAKVETSETRERPRTLLVPGQSKPSGSGLNPCFLWDNAEYTLGYKPEAAKPERTRAAFESFRAKHAALADTIDDPAFRAACAFLRAWDPESALSYKSREGQRLDGIVSSFGVFRIRGQTEYVHQRPNVRSWWESHQQRKAGSEEDDAGDGWSLASGERARLARLHEPKIKGVLGAQTSGATVVSFNQPSFESYGKSQGSNAPVGVDDAFKYCTALNQLTTSDKHRVRIGPDTYVFWAEGADDDDIATDFAAILTDADSSQVANDGRLRAALTNAREGRLFGNINGDRPFYVLGLSPNAARLSVRLWLRSTIGEMRKSLQTHAANLAIDPVPERNALPSLRRLVLETVPPKGGYPDADRLNPCLAPDLTRSILTGTPYPRSLFVGVVDRARVEGLADKESRNDHRDAAWRRCAVIRAYLVRNCQMEVPVSLDVSRKDTPYLLGRLFAVLERIQEESLQDGSGEWKEINRTVKDSYFGSASATPGAIFPHLLKLKNHHINKYDHTRKKLRLAREREVGEIVGGLTSLPTTLATEAQGLFAIGYYHQRQTYFRKRDNPTEQTAAEQDD
jgi:CRISPR-associated protein Csd1